jgi:hypothetical protein
LKGEEAITYHTPTHPERKQQSFQFGYTEHKKAISIMYPYLGIAVFVSACSYASAFVQPPANPATLSLRQPSRTSPSFHESLVLQATTSTKPLYDGTNYTFPDTTKPEGVAEMLEVTFVNACMQLREGYVDVLKMFIASAMAGYEFGYSIEDIQKELEICPKQSANRPLMDEERNLRYSWYNLVYLTLATLGHPTRVGSVVDSIPASIRDEYQEYVCQAVDAKKDGRLLSVEDLLKENGQGLSVMEKAILAQSLRLVTLTFTVMQDAEEARENEPDPPTPPIEGAF